MGRATRTELNQQTARVLARVAAGERVTITDRGRPVAEISPPAGTRREQLEASGFIAPARTTGPLPFAPVALDVTSKEILDEVRADRV